jgi:plasmid stabilization system protein ParE
MIMSIGGIFMPGNKYTAKQERKAEHIEKGYRKEGVSKDEAERRAWATVNKQDGGGKNPGGSGRKGAKKTD